MLTADVLVPPLRRESVGAPEVECCTSELARCHIAELESRSRDHDPANRNFARSAGTEISLCTHWAEAVAKSPNVMLTKIMLTKIIPDVTHNFPSPWLAAGKGAKGAQIR